MLSIAEDFARFIYLRRDKMYNDKRKLIKKMWKG